MIRCFNIHFWIDFPEAREASLAPSPEPLLPQGHGRRGAATAPLTEDPRTRPSHQHPSGVQRTKETQEWRSTSG